MIKEQFILPEDVSLIATCELPHTFRQKLTCENSDYIASRPTSRRPSVILSSETAAFLQVFREPKTIVDAVLQYSQLRGTDPHQTLDAIYPVLHHAMRAGLLVIANPKNIMSKRTRFSTGDHFEQFVVVQPIQCYEDTEVYKIKNNDRMYALKLAAIAPSDDLRRSMAREIEILDLLDGSISPRLFGFDVSRERAYIVSEWRTGDSASAFAAECRIAGNEASIQRLREACGSILKAYARLHAKNVLHGDIHPRNILIDDNGQVSLVDFGLSERENDFSSERFVRRGVSFFFEPEYALARLNGETECGSSAKGEQYALAAILFYLLTGEHYIDFKLDQSQLRQIVDEGPRSFASCGAAEWVAGESVLRIALSKEPNKRYESTYQFATCYCQALDSATASGFSAPFLPKTQAVLERLLDRLAFSSLRNVSEETKYSVCFGSAGVAFAAYRLAQVREDPKLLAAADIVVEQALRSASQPLVVSGTDGLSYGDSLISLFHGLAGVWCVRSLVSAAQGDDYAASRAVRAFGAIACQPCTNPDLTLGKSSLLLGVVSLLLTLGPENISDRKFITEVGDAVHAEVWETISRCASIASYEPLRWLGIAHGWAGVLYASLLWHQVTQRAVPASLALRLNELVALAEPVASGLRWPQRCGQSAETSKPAAGWCHGTAGYVHLWTLAHRVLDDARYLEIAERAAMYTWEGICDASGGLCCGAGGQAYAFLNFGRHSQETRWLKRAYVLAERAATQPNLRLNSLYHGDIGVGLLGAEIRHPERAAMPLFEPRA